MHHLGLDELRYVHTCADRTQAENWLQHKSLYAFTHTRSRGGGGEDAKSVPQQMGPTPNFPRPLRNRALQTIFVLKKWQIHPRPLRVYVNIPVVTERECQNPPVSAPPVSAPPIYERSFNRVHPKLRLSHNALLFCMMKLQVLCGILPKSEQILPLRFFHNFDYLRKRSIS